MRPVPGMANSEEKLLALLSGQYLESKQSKSTQGLDFVSVLKFVLILSPIYGMAMGGFAWVAGYKSLATHWPQMVYSALKMPILLLVTVAIALPAFFVFNSLAGLRDDFLDAMHAILLSLATFSLAIVTLAPFTLLFYYSMPQLKESYRVAVLFNAMVFAIASCAAQISLLRGYQVLIARRANHRQMLWVWLFLFALVGIQFGWTLRPFIGNPFQETTFFREESFTSAYLQLIRIIRSLL